MIFSIEWAMPSRWTFSIPPINRFVLRYHEDNGISIDPFCGKSTLGTYRNDLALSGKLATVWLDELIDKGVQADLVFFDPPYSPRQISECYKSVGLKVGMKETQNATLYRDVRQRLDSLLKPGGIALCFGWSSSGMGKSYETMEVMLVQHGGAHNDTICVAQRKAL